MATTKDLVKLVDRELGKGQGPFLLRIGQDAGLLPKVKRGAFRSMVDLTPEHLADFVMVLAATRPVGRRNAEGARVGVERFARLKGNAIGERGVWTLRQALVFFLERYRDDDDFEKDYTCTWILFVDDANKPEAEIRFIGDADQKVSNYSDPNAEASSVREATVIEGDLLRALAALLRKAESEPDAA